MTSLEKLLEDIRDGKTELNDFLPNFGSDPKNTEGIWSWDDTHWLVGTCRDDLYIEDRDDFMTFEKKLCGVFLNNVCIAKYSDAGHVELRLEQNGDVLQTKTLTTPVFDSEFEKAVSEDDLHYNQARALRDSISHFFPSFYFQKR